MNWKKLLNSGRLRTTGRIKDARTEFESDFGRIIFSPAVRRMHDKTQVFPLTTNFSHSKFIFPVQYKRKTRTSLFYEFGLYDAFKVHIVMIKLQGHYILLQISILYLI